MARSPIDLPRMQNQPRPRVAVARAPMLVPQEIEAAPKPRKPRMMRQYELVERVQHYNPERQRGRCSTAPMSMPCRRMASRSAPPAIPISPTRSRSPPSSPTSSSTTRPSRRRCCTTRSRTPTPPAPRSTELFGHEIGELVEGLTKLKKLDLVTKEAKQAENLRKLLLAIADDVRVLLVKLADRLHNMRTLEHMPPEARRASPQETLDIYAPLAGRMGMQEMREELEDLAFRDLNPDAYKVISERLDALAERSKRPGSPRSSSSSPASSPTAASPPKSPAGASAPIRSGARWSASPSASSSFPTSSASASSSKTSATATGRSASCTPPGRSCPAGSRTTSRRRSRTTTARSTPP